MWNAYAPFSLEVWVIIFLALLIQSASATLIRYFEYKFLRINDTFELLERSWYYTRAFLLQDYEVGFKSYSGREKILKNGFPGIFAFIVFLMLQVVLISSFYKSVILSFLFKPPDLSPFHSSAEMTTMIASGDYKMITTKVNYFGNW